MMSRAAEREPIPVGGLLVSVIIHIMLLAIAVAFSVNSVSAPQGSKGEERRLSILYLPPRMSDQSLRRRTGIQANPSRVSAGVKHSLSGAPTLEIPDPEPAALMDALDREGGVVALSAYPPGRRVSVIMKVADKIPRDLATPEELNHFFAVELVDLAQWKNLPAAWRDCTHCAVFALFPGNIAERIADAAAQRSGCQQGAQVASVRFDGKEPGHFRILKAGPCLAAEGHYKDVESDQR